MYEVTMTHENLVKNLEVYRIDFGRGFYLHSINKNIEEFMKNISIYRNVSGKPINFKITLEEDEEICIERFLPLETVIFEFPDEETAFYFKLKFC